MLNKVQLIGRLGSPADVKTMQGGDNIATLSVATSESWKDKITNEWKEKTEWHKVVCFGFNADKAERFEKGTLLYVEGQLQTRKWTDKAGVDKYTTEIVLQKFNGTIRSLVKNEVASIVNTEVAQMDDEIPF
tara:strand:- start:218 stop:613 length:396 start_codon:yes stop_codon:yes gene_type:complete